MKTSTINSTVLTFNYISPSPPLPNPTQPNPTQPKSSPLFIQISRFSKNHRLTNTLVEEDFLDQFQLMKRSITNSQFVSGADEFDRKKKKKIQIEGGDVISKEVEAVLLDENLLSEVLKHVDARTLAASACVNKLWKKTAQDESLWELICTEHYAKNLLQLRVVVLALGGFRRLYSLYLLPLLKPSSSATASTWPCLPNATPVPDNTPGTGMKAQWGKDEVNLSLSLLSIRCYEKMFKKK